VVVTDAVVVDALGRSIVACPPIRHGHDATFDAIASEKRSIAASLLNDTDVDGLHHEVAIGVRKTVHLRIHLWGTRR
jgi:hypothetical protein